MSSVKSPPGPVGPALHGGGPFEDDLGAVERAWDALLIARGYDGRARVKTPPPPPPPPPPVAPPEAPPVFATRPVGFALRVTNWRRLLPDWNAVPGRARRRPPAPSLVEVADIIAAACRVFGVERNEILSPRRDRRVARPRQACCWLAVKLTALSLPAIGRVIGGRDHTTVMHAARAVETLIAHDPEFAARVDATRAEAIRLAEGRTP